MRSRYPKVWLICVLFLGQAAGSACAQDSPPVPPWGRELDDEHSPTETTKPDAAPITHADEAARHGWRFAGDYWLAWTKNDRIPPLLTTGPTSDPRPGAVGRPFTRILYGDAVDFEERHGGRFTLEAPVGAAGDWSLAANYFLLGSRDVGIERFSPGTPVLARPFFDAVNHREDSALVTYPGLAGGRIAVIGDSFLQGAEANWQRVVRCHEHCRATLFAGFRYLNLEEDLTVAEASLVAPTAPAFAGRRINVQDRFGADNDFFGGQVGMNLELHFHHRCTLGVMSKVALGSVQETINIRGRTTIDTAPATDEPAGMLALATNSGRFSRNTFAVVPEVSAKLGVRVTERLTIFGGYAFLYWSNVARPGEQIDRNLNANLIPTSATFGGPVVPPQPAPLFRTSDYWAHGMTWGLEFRY